MNKLEGSKTVVVGGKKDVTQQYCGTVGGQSSDFSTMDTEVKVSNFTRLSTEWLDGLACACLACVQATIASVCHHRAGG